jgi:hypothetical protein
MHPALAKFLLAASGLVALVLLAGSMSGPASVAGANTPQFDPNNFVRNVDNPFFPLDPGTTYFYEGQEDGIPSSTTTEVTNDTKRILGVRATVVHDLAYVDGVLVEETFDWYAQDKQGNVWYLGEDSRELDEFGNVISTEGSWEAGVNGAQAGIIMLADPRKGDRYRQEFAPGVAEDTAQVLSLDESICVSYGCFDGVLLTKEWTPLNRGVVDNKYYAEGIGFIFSDTVKGGDETLELVAITS